MPHFCHIMTNNILHETSFPIISRHTFLFLTYTAKDERNAEQNPPQTFKRLPKKVQRPCREKTVSGMKIVSSVERISLYC